MSREKKCLSCAKMAFGSVKKALFKNINSLWSLFPPIKSHPWSFFFSFFFSILVLFVSLLFLPSLLVVFAVFWMVHRYAS
jgi:hypothetical protein